MARFGEDGWQCQDAKPTDGEEPLGGVFVKEHCEKTTADRHFLLDSALYRRSGEPLRDFVSSAELTILAQAAPAGLELSGAWVPATDEKGADVPLYLTIANHAEQPDTLMRVRCPVAQFTEKRTVDRGEGGAAGREVRTIPVPVHDTLALDAEGFHIVLLQTTQPLLVGNTFTCSLAFQQAGAQELDVVVKAP
jgi:copper(I)-binding protein